MGIISMKKLKLVGLKSQRDYLIHELLVLGCVQVSEPKEIDDPELAQILTREKAGANERKADYDELLWALQLLDRYAPVKSKLLSPKPEVTQDVILDDSELQQYVELAKQLDVTDDRIKRIEVEESHSKGLIETLKPWKKLDTPLELLETKTCFVLLGTIPATAIMKELEKDLAQVTEAAKVFEVCTDSEMHYIQIVGMKSDRQEITEVLRQYSFAVASVSECKGTASENIKSINNELDRFSKEKKKLSDEIILAAHEREKLKLCSDRMMTKLDVAENEEKFTSTISTFIIEGWIPTSEENKLANVLKNFDCAWETDDPTEEELADVPVKLKSKKINDPMELVTEMYSLPAYNGVDPNGLMMPFFTIFFGIMFADLGYGLILLVAGLLFMTKAKPRGTMKSAAGLIIAVGVSCSIFGVLSGGFFGDLLPQLAEQYGWNVDFGLLEHPIIDPLGDPMTVLIGSLVIGFVHLMVGVAVSGYLQIKDGHPMDAVMDVGSLWLFFIGIALGALGITWYVALAGVIAIVLTQGRSAPSIGGKLGGGLFALYNTLSGYFGDILSYSRLMALMLASAVIAQVFNTLGFMTGNIVGFILIFLIGHALNFALNIIGTFVHTVRLQYLEFFGKFYRDGGKEYDPLSIKTNFVNVNNLKED